MKEGATLSQVLYGSGVSLRCHLGPLLCNINMNINFFGILLGFQFVFMKWLLIALYKTGLWGASLQKLHLNSFRNHIWSKWHRRTDQGTEGWTPEKEVCGLPTEKGTEEKAKGETEGPGSQSDQTTGGQEH